jgi:hypothetical protein
MDLAATDADARDSARREVTMAAARTKSLAVGLKLSLTIGLLFVASTSAVHADGSVLRLRHQSDGVEVSIFTDPPPIRSGSVDVTIVVVPVPPGARRPAPWFKVCAYPSGAPERKICDSTEVRTPAMNKPFRAGHLELPEGGRWQIEIASDLGGDGGVVLGPFLVEVEEGAVGGNSWVLWVGLPTAAVVVFAAHQRLVHRRPRQPASPPATPGVS